ncbi:MAG: PilN domain-containing protein [Pseudomonas sp.]
MIRVNLLPHRALKRKARERQFLVMAGMTAAVSIAIIVLVHGIISARISYQQERNTYLEKEIAILDKQIDEIKKLKEQIQVLLARKKVVESLQTNRAETVHLLDQLVRQLPDGVYLKGVKQTGNKVSLNGYAQTNARVSTLLRSLESSPWFESPNLVEIKAVTQGGLRLSEFSLTFIVARKTEAAAPARGPKPKG